MKFTENETDRSTSSLLNGVTIPGILILLLACVPQKHHQPYVKGLFMMVLMNQAQERRKNRAREETKSTEGRRKASKTPVWKFIIIKIN